MPTTSAAVGNVEQIGGRAMLVADWLDVSFIHFRVEPALLQPFVPFELDTFGGDALVSLVAFTQHRLRPAFGGLLAEKLAAPLAEHEFLNLRTYIKHSESRGIYFIAEWIPNRLAVLLGPALYGLPYRIGRHRYRSDDEVVEGYVSAQSRALEFRAHRQSTFRPAGPNTLDEFLLERYAAFTHHRGTSRRFAVAHTPWPQQRVGLELLDATILSLGGEWHRGASFIHANYSPGVRGVRIGAPQKVNITRRSEPDRWIHARSSSGATSPAAVASRTCSPLIASD